MKCKNNSTFISGFIKKYEPYIRNHAPGFNLNDIVICDTTVSDYVKDQNSELVSASFVDSPYMADTSKNVIYYFTDFDDLNFTDEEKSALILHEIGHLYFKKISQESPALDEEIFADEFTCHIISKQHLIDALCKMIKDDRCKEGKRNMIKRKKNLEVHNYTLVNKIP